MSKSSKLFVGWALPTISLLVCGAHPTSACRFNVREVGFVDLGIQPYYFYWFVSQDTPKDFVSSFKEVSDAAFMGSNIQSVIIDVNQPKDHPAMKFFASAQGTRPAVIQAGTFPAAVLVSPDGQSLLVPIVEPNHPFSQTLSSALDSILSSPKRKEILQQVSKTYGVVLLIEGTDAQENQKAKQAAAAAIEQVRSQMEWLPKPIAHAPVLVVVEHKSLREEKILLWSLGLDAEKITKPHAAVLYGRARWLGPMFVGEQITEDNLTAILFVVGGDCECGLDQRWLQGTMLPAKWDENLLQLVATTLEFDPEDPMVKMEISWIVRRGYYSYPDVPSGYRELVADEPWPTAGELDANIIAPNELQIANPPKEDKRITAPRLRGDKLAPAEAEGGQEGLALKKPLYLIAGLTVLIVASGLLIVVRRGQRNL